MIKKELERDEAFAWEVLDTAPYAVLAMADGKGEPYCVPMSPSAGWTYSLSALRPCRGKAVSFETQPQSGADSGIVL